MCFDGSAHGLARPRPTSTSTRLGHRRQTLYFTYEQHRVPPAPVAPAGQRRHLPLERRQLVHPGGRRLGHRRPARPSANVDGLIVDGSRPTSGPVLQQRHHDVTGPRCGARTRTSCYVQRRRPGRSGSTAPPPGWHGGQPRPRRDLPRRRAPLRAHRRRLRPDLLLHAGQHSTRRASAERPTTPTSTAGTDGLRPGASTPARRRRVPAGRQRGRLHRVDDTHFYVSFASEHRSPAGPRRCRTRTSSSTTTAPGRCTSTAPRTAWAGNANLDLDAISIVGSTLYFSTRATRTRPASAAPRDDADIYTLERHGRSPGVCDATVRSGSPAAPTSTASTVDSTPPTLPVVHRPTPPCPGSATVQDEDVVRNDAGTWSVYFDGTAHGLGRNAPRRSTRSTSRNPLADGPDE